VKRTFRLFDEFSDVVQGKTRFQIAEIADSYCESLPLGRGTPIDEASAHRLIDDLAEGPAGTSRFRPELGRDIVIQRERRPHVLMLVLRHHDVNPDASWLALSERGSCNRNPLYRLGPSKSASKDLIPTRF
jgi:hypothetical protein